MQQQRLRKLTGVLASVFLSFCGLQSCLAADTCDRLLKIIQSHDTGYRSVHLPDDVKAVLRQVDSDDYFQACADLWNQGFDRERILAVLDKVDAGKKPTDSEMTHLKDVRVKVRLLRSVYLALDEGHEAPQVIDELTTVIGHLQDDLKAGDRRLARKEADSLRDLMRKKELDQIADEIDEFHGANGTSFRKWIKGEADEIRQIMGDEGDSKKVTPKKFHEMRKSITEILAVVDVINAVDPSPESRQLGKYLSSLNTDMGNLHDELVGKKLQGAIEYERDKIVIPPRIRALLLQFVDSVN